MTAHTYILDPEAAPDGDEGLRRARAFRRLAERGLVHGDADERALVLDIIDFLDKGAEGGLEAALGLNGPGHTGALRRYRQQRRDDDLRRLWPICGPKLSAYAAAHDIAQAWDRYDTDVWPRHRRSDNLPKDEPEATFARLLTAGHKPLSQHRIREILTAQVGELQPVETVNRTTDVCEERS